MSLPPCLMRLKIVDNRTNINLWLPLFIAWFFLALLAISLAPLFLILVLVLWPIGWGKFIYRLGLTFYQVLCALKQTEVDVRKQNETVLIYFK